MVVRGKLEPVKKFFVGLVVAIILLAALAEGGVRWYVSNQLKNDMGDGASISFGLSPVVASAVTGKVGHVDMTLPDTLKIDYPDGENAAPSITGSPASRVKIQGLNIKDPNNQTADSLVLDTRLTDEYMLAQVQDGIAQNANNQGGDFANALVQSLIRVTNITSNPSDGTISVEFTDGAAMLTLRPSAEDGQLSFQAEKASLFGVELPANISEAISSALRDSASQMAGNLRIDSINVEDGGIALQLSGTNVNFNEVGVTENNSGGNA